jgi:hypothetical protein
MITDDELAEAGRLWELENSKMKEKQKTNTPLTLYEKQALAFNEKYAKEQNSHAAKLFSSEIKKGKPFEIHGMLSGTNLFQFSFLRNPMLSFNKNEISLMADVMDEYKIIMDDHKAYYENFIQIVEKKVNNETIAVNSFLEDVEKENIVLASAFRIPLLAHNVFKLSHEEFLVHLSKYQIGYEYLSKIKTKFHSKIYQALFRRELWLDLLKDMYDPRYESEIFLPDLHPTLILPTIDSEWLHMTFLGDLIKNAHNNRGASSDVLNNGTKVSWQEVLAYAHKSF